MQGLVIIYVKEPPPPPKVELTPYGETRTREIKSTPTVDGRSQHSAIGALVPHVYIDGKPIGMLRNLEVVNNADFMRPSVRMERVLFSPDDAIRTMTPEEHGRWIIECRFEELMEFVQKLPVAYQLLTIKQEGDLAEISCMGNSLRTGKELVAELLQKFRQRISEARYEGDLNLLVKE